MGSFSDVLTYNYLPISCQNQTNCTLLREYSVSEHSLSEFPPLRKSLHSKIKRNPVKVYTIFTFLEHVFQYYLGN